MYFPRNWEFGSALSKLRNFRGGGLNTPVCTPLNKTEFTQIFSREVIKDKASRNGNTDNVIWLLISQKVGSPLA
jgi:hypothetical protein